MSVVKQTDYYCPQDFALFPSLLILCMIMLQWPACNLLFIFSRYIETCFFDLMIFKEILKRKTWIRAETVKLCLMLWSSWAKWNNHYEMIRLGFKCCDMTRLSVRSLLGHATANLHETWLGFWASSSLFLGSPKTMHSQFHGVMCKCLGSSTTLCIIVTIGVGCPRRETD